MYALLPLLFAFFVLRRFKALFFLLCTFVPHTTKEARRTQGNNEKTLFVLCLLLYVFSLCFLCFFRLACLLALLVCFLLLNFCTFAYFCAILSYIYNVEEKKFY